MNSIEIYHLKKEYSKFLMDIPNLIIPSGCIIGIIGENGSGKTTLLNCLGLIQNLAEGNVYIDGKNASLWKYRDKTMFWRDHAAFIYQDYGIIDNESVFYNVTLNKNKQSYKGADKVLSLVGLEGRGNDFASVLSGGEKQRLGIARAIYKKAVILFADEPTASLDFKNRELVVNLLKMIRDAGAMIIIATHDERLISECDESIDMEQWKA